MGSRLAETGELDLSLRSILAVAAIALGPVSWATYSFTIADIQIQGLMRVTSGEVYSGLRLDIGDLATPSAIQDTVRILYRTNLFDDIQVLRDGDVLILAVSERPAIRKIEFDGNRLLKDEQLEQILASEGLAQGEIFRQATLDRIANELGRAYNSEGRYSATIEATHENVGRNQVEIVINIEEGSTAKIRQIEIVGNETYPTRELLDALELKHPTLFGFVKGHGRYSRQKLQSDLEAIEAFYQDRGHVGFRVRSVQVSMSPDKKQVYITLNLTEGPIYEINDIDLIGDIEDVNPEYLESLIALEPGDTFSSRLVTFTEDRITQSLGISGFTFASATGVPEVRDDGTVDLKFVVNSGKRVYVNRVNFSGNTVTQDHVLRREMRQIEGGWASTNRVDQSKTRLERLGFFGEVTVETPPVAGTDDQIDLNISVTEQPTGSISGSLGYQEVSGVILGAGFAQSNLAGTGNELNVDLNWSEFVRSASLSFYNPYFTKDGVSRGYTLYFRDQNYDRYNLIQYSSASFGAGVRYGVPIGETRRLQFSARAENTSLGQNQFNSSDVSDFLLTEGAKFLNLKLEGLYVSSLLNRPLFATRGRAQTVALEATAPGSDLSFYRVNYRAEVFSKFPFNRNWPLRLRMELGYGGTYGETLLFPFYEHFYGGGFGSVRGYERSSLGPRTDSFGSRFSNVSGNALGGNVQTEFSAEVIFPLPFIENPHQVRSVFFLDAGNIFHTDCSETVLNCYEPSLDQLRYSAGISVSWNSAMGLLSFSLAAPFNNSELDDVKRFSFEFGAAY